MIVHHIVEYYSVEVVEFNFTHDLPKGPLSKAAAVLTKPGTLAAALSNNVGHNHTCTLATAHTPQQSYIGC